MQHKINAARFKPAILKSARRIVDDYSIVLRFEDGEWHGRGLEYPEALGVGKTATACVHATQRALTVAVATMLEAGQTPPPPAREGQRSAQDDASTS